MATVAVIGALQMFDQAYHRRRRRTATPNNSLMTIVLYLYNAAFRQFDFGYAAAVGIVLFVIIFTPPCSSGASFGGSRRSGERR